MIISCQKFGNNIFIDVASAHCEVDFIWNVLHLYLQDQNSIGLSKGQCLDFTESNEPICILF